MASRDIRPGEPVTLHTPRGREVPAVAGMPCSDTAPGHWACGTHPDVGLANNLSASGHFGSPGQHVEVWVCHQHGPEAPKVIVQADGTVRQ